MVLLYACHNVDRLKWGMDPAAVLAKIDHALTYSDIKHPAAKLEVLKVVTLCNAIIEGLLIFYLYT